MRMIIGAINFVKSYIPVLKKKYFDDRGVIKADQCLLSCVSSVIAS